jgi:hypothetical protein
MEKKGELAFRAGTALNKLIFPEALKDVFL